VAGDAQIHSAIGVRRANQGQVNPINAVSQCTFENTDRRFYLLDVTEDGGKTTNFRDIDGNAKKNIISNISAGSVTGYSNSVALPNSGFYLAPTCLASSIYSAVCPQKYVSVEILDMNSNAGNSITLNRNQHLGTDHSKSRITLKGFSDAGTWRYHPIVSVGASYLVTFSNLVSSNLAFQLLNSDIGKDFIVTPRVTIFFKVKLPISRFVILLELQLQLCIVDMELLWDKTQFQAQMAPPQYPLPLREPAPPSPMEQVTFGIQLVPSSLSLSNNYLLTKTLEISAPMEDVTLYGSEPMWVLVLAIALPLLIQEIRFRKLLVNG
jgi:hypothetical protein